MNCTRFLPCRTANTTARTSYNCSTTEEVDHQLLLITLEISKQRSAVTKTRGTETRAGALDIRTGYFATSPRIMLQASDEIRTWDNNNGRV